MVVNKAAIRVRNYLITFYLALLVVITFIQVDTSSYHAKNFNIRQRFEQLCNCSSSGLIFRLLLVLMKNSCIAVRNVDGY